MKGNFYLALAGFFIYFGYKAHQLLQPPPLPQLEDTWWGPGTPKPKPDWTLELEPLNITARERDLKELKWRLQYHRNITPPLEGIHHEYGFNTNLLKEVIEFWRTEYNWTERELFFNQYPQYLLKVQGLDVHVVHVNRGQYRGYKKLPLLLLHGWPGSVREFYDIIPKLAEPQKGRKYMFEIIAPHLPGFGFSQAAVRPGLGAAQMAVLFKNLMHDIGFKEFYVQGGDFGAIILQHMAVLFPESVLGFHSNMCTIYTPKSYLRTLLGTVFPSWYVKPEHYDRVYPLSEQFYWRLRETGYLHLQATKPDTLGVALNDSPIGMAAYILEKFITGTNRTWLEQEDGGRLKDTFTYTSLIDNIMFYWLTSSATTSFRLYAETFNKKHMGLGILRHPVQVPSACARFSYDFYTADGLLPEIYPHLLQLTDHEGGHFAAMQKPDVLANDIHDAVEKFVKFNKEFRKKEEDEKSPKK